MEKVSQWEGSNESLLGRGGLRMLKYVVVNCVFVCVFLCIHIFYTESLMFVLSLAMVYIFHRGHTVVRR